MLQPITAPLDRQRSWIVITSVVVHCLVLLVVLRPAEPQIVKVHQLRLGNNGRSLARLYWRGENTDAASDADSRMKRDSDQTLRSKHLQDPSKSLQLRLEKHERQLASNENDRSLGAGKARNAATAGSQYGSLNSGDLTGSEIRPALWVGGPNPQIAASIFAEGLEGTVIVEITIDDNGKVVATHVLSGLSPAVDGRVVEALEMAQFVPAKRNGVSIPSRQDVYYHFPR